MGLTDFGRSRILILDRQHFSILSKQLHHPHFGPPDLMRDGHYAVRMTISFPSFETIEPYRCAPLQFVLRDQWAPAPGSGCRAPEW